MKIGLPNINSPQCPFSRKDNILNEMDQHSVSSTDTTENLDIVKYLETQSSLSNFQNTQKSFSQQPQFSQPYHLQIPEISNLQEQMNYERFQKPQQSLSKDEKSEFLAKITLEVKNGIDEIVIYTNSDIIQLASDFCLKHQYNVSCIPSLVQDIHSELKKLAVPQSEYLQHEQRINSQQKITSDKLQNCDQQQLFFNQLPQQQKTLVRSSSFFIPSTDYTVNSNLQNNNAPTYNQQLSKSLQKNYSFSYVNEDKSPPKNTIKSENRSPLQEKKWSNHSNIQNNNQSSSQNQYQINTQGKIGKLKSPICSNQQVLLQQNQQQQFSPYVSKESKRIAQTIRPKNQSIYERLYQEAKIVKENKEQWRQTMLKLYYPNYQEQEKRLQTDYGNEVWLNQKLRNKTPERQQQQQIQQPQLHQQKAYYKLKSSKKLTKPYDQNKENLIIEKILETSPKKYSSNKKFKMQQLKGASSNVKEQQSHHSILSQDTTLNQTSLYSGSVLIQNSKNGQQNEVNNSSSIIQNNRKLFKILEYMFLALDADCDGFISQCRMDLSKLNSSVQDIIQDAINVMRHSSKQLNFQDFCQLLSDMNIDRSLMNYIFCERDSVSMIQQDYEQTGFLSPQDEYSSFFKELADQKDNKLLLDDSKTNDNRPLPLPIQTSTSPNFGSLSQLQRNLFK